MSRPDEGGSPDRLTGDEAAAVFRRAAELDLRAGAAHSGGTIELAAVEQAGAEAGLSRESIRRALLELQAGATDTERRPAHSLLRVTEAAERKLDGDPRRIERAVDRFMHQQTLQVRRRLGERTTWERNSGLGATLRRSLDFGHRISLKPVSSAATCVVTDGGLVLVRIELHFHGSRAGYIALPAGAAGATAAASGSVLIAPVGAEWALLAGGAGSAVTAAGYLMARWGYRNTRDRSITGVERFLDDLESRHGPAR